VAVHARGEIVEVSGGDGANELVDLTGTDLTRSFCYSDNRECVGNNLEEPRFTATIRLCKAQCSQNVNCLSAFYDKEKNCHVRARRCDRTELTYVRGAKTLYRLREGEECPSGMHDYVDVQTSYSSKFCMMRGKSCEGHNLYRTPYPMPTYMDCLIKCTRIRSCAGADYVDGKCFPKDYMCTDAELENGADVLNFMRLEEGVNECPSNRAPPPPLVTEPPPVVTTPPPPRKCQCTCEGDAAGFEVDKQCFIAGAASEMLPPR